MAIAEGNAEVPDDNAWGLCRMPFWQTTATGGDGGGGGGGSSSSAAAFSSTQYGGHRSRGTGGQQQQQSRSGSSGSSVSSMAKSLLPTKRRFSLDPATKLYFPYEPGKQVRSAIRIKNIRKSHAAFKFQTTAPKSCFMRPPGGILAPGESIIATVFKFVEAPEDNESQPDQKCNVKFKIMSLKVKLPIEYVPELFDEQKDQASVEQILRVVFLDVERPCREMEKLKSQLAEAEATLETRKKPSEEIGSKIACEGLVIDEWKERRERYLARQHGDGVDST